MAPHCSDWMAELPARPLVPWLRRILSTSRQIPDSIFCAIPSCNPRHCQVTRQKQSQTVAFAHLRWGLVMGVRLAIPAGCIGSRWFSIDCVYGLPRVLLRQAQPQRLKPIEFWPKGTTEVVPFQDILQTFSRHTPTYFTTPPTYFKTHADIFHDTADINNVAIVSPDKFGLC